MNEKEKYNQQWLGKKEEENNRKKIERKERKINNNDSLKFPGKMSN